MKQLETMKEQLMACVQSQMGNLQNVDAQELGAAVDMIKDLEEAIYYCTITKAMNEKEEKGAKEHHYYTEKVMYPEYYYGEDRRYMPMERYYRDMDKGYGKMYYNGGNGSSSSGSGSSSSGNGGSMGYEEKMYSHPLEMRDSREGRSPMSRKSYMESKEMHKDKSAKIKELETYMTELSQDIVEMIEGASPEEQQLLERKMTQLANKIGRINNV